MRKYMMWVLLAALLATQGCQHCGSRPCPPAGAASAYGPSDSWLGRSRFLHPLAPRSMVVVPPPGAVVYPPGALQPVQPFVAPAPPVPVAPAPDIRGYTPPSDASPPADWRPAPEASERLRPQPQRPEAGTAPPALPVGIPRFDVVKKNVAAGLRPTHLEGLQWLKDNGYRMALYIRAPGESDDADRKQFEDKCGMKYAGLVLSPDALTLEVVDQFNAVVADPANRPLFVYDKDGSLAGALWYLHFRMIDQQTDEDARAAALRLGLKEEHRDMWVAIQKILGGRR